MSLDVEPSAPFLLALVDSPELPSPWSMDSNHRSVGHQSEGPTSCGGSLIGSLMVHANAQSDSNSHTHDPILNYAF
jgi:hypothetical protein